jgi:ribosomal protein L1
MPGDDPKRTLADADITAGALITTRGATAINDFVAAVRRAQEQRQDVVLPLADAQKVAVLLKQVSQHSAISDGTDFVNNNSDPNDPIKSGD